MVWHQFEGAGSGCCRVELSTSILPFELEMAE